MSTTSRISNATRELLNSVPSLFRSVILQTAEGKNPHVQFSFRELKLIRGTMPHPPNTDQQEVRSSITIQFNDSPGGPIIAHLFNDGSIKTSVEMHQENNLRRAEDAYLTAEENKFPALGQTAARRQAEARKMERIKAARLNGSWSIMQKQLEKSSAEEEFRLFLHYQAQQRAQAAGLVARK